MGLRAEIQSDIAEAFDTDLSDAVKPITLIDRKNGVYDPATGDLTGAETTTDTRGVVSPFTSLEVLYSGGSIDIKDSKIIILANEISIEPSTEHIVKIANEEYSILKVKKYPADATYTLHTRKS